MKRILIAIPVIFFSVTSAHALEQGCNRAVQNWQNGSQDTCPVADAGHSGDSFETQSLRQRHCYKEGRQMRSSRKTKSETDT